MEKLQAALQKAREKRDGQTPAYTRAQAGSTSDKPRRGPEDNIARRWQALTKIDVLEQSLEQHLIVTRDVSKEAMPFDILRTKILLHMKQKGWRSLAITSPMPQSGKTTIACNLALGLGRQTEMSAILFDFDLGDPSVGSFFQHSSAHTAADMLQGKVPFQEYAVRIGENVAVATPSVPEKDPTRVLLAEQTAQTIQQIEKSYQPDIMIFDLPSVLTTDNARAFLKNVDCALIVARAGETRYGHFNLCESEVAEYTNVLGVAFNAFRHGRIHTDYD